MLQLSNRLRCVAVVPRVCAPQVKFDMAYKQRFADLLHASGAADRIEGLALSRYWKFCFLGEHMIDVDGEATVNRPSHFVSHFCWIHIFMQRAQASQNGRLLSGR